MRLALITNNFPPDRNSGAVQLRDLAREFAAQGHELTVLVPSNDQVEPFRIERDRSFEIARLRAPFDRNAGRARRAIGEFAMPYAMWRSYRGSPLRDRVYDGVIFYSPSTFFGPLVQRIKAQSQCPSYLIIRDIFPDWIVDLGLMRKGPAYYAFDAVSRYQYSVADIIGVQTPGNLSYFPSEKMKAGQQVEVLHNWLADPVASGCSIDVAATPLAGRRIYVYAGNMGIAQGMGVLLDLAEAVRDDRTTGFLFVGRGTDARALRQDAVQRGLDNVLFHDEIEPDEIASLYAQCDVGLVSLDLRHKSHNIPGKFISYMHSGLPVLASVNPGNDLVGMMAEDRVGYGSTSGSVDDLVRLKQALDAELAVDAATGERCKRLARRHFSAVAAVRQIVEALGRRSG